MVAADVGARHKGKESQPSVSSSSSSSAEEVSSTNHMARLCEPGPEPAPPTHDGQTAGVAGLSATNGVGSGTAASGDFNDTVAEVKGGMVELATVAAGGVAAAEEGPDAAGWNGTFVGCGDDKGVVANGTDIESNGTSCSGGEGSEGSEGGRTVPSSNGELKAAAAASEVGDGGARVPAVVPAAMAASSINVAAVAAAVKNVETSFPSTAPAAPAAVASTVAGRGAAAPAGRGGRSRRRRKNAAKSAAAAAAAAAAAEAAAAKNNDEGDADSDTDDDDDKQAEGVPVANGRAEDVCEEDDEGNVEYKLKLVNPPLARLEHLFTQV